MAGLQFVSSQQYHQGLLAAVSHAKQRVIVAAMVVIAGGKTDPIFEAIVKAARRGVKVTVLLDIFTAATTINGVKHGRKRWQQTRALLDEITNLGGTVYRVGRMGAVPYRGRCHVKISIVDDQSYSFGGINFTGESFANADYMIQAPGADYANCLEELVTRIGNAKGALPNGEVQLQRDSVILFDGGRTHDSIIYQQSCELAAQARRAYYVSQMAPSGALARLLRETDTEYYTNRPEQMRVPAAWGQAFDLQRFRITNSYTRKRYIHAKFILFELRNGKKALVSGSNNFSYRGVAYGTKEIALRSTNLQLWQDLYNFLDTKIR